MNRASLSFFLLALAACSGADAADRTDDPIPIPVRVALPVFRSALPEIVLTGTLGAKEEIPLGFKVGGVVARIAAEAGQLVREGDLLAELTLTEIDAQVATAREARDKARRDLERTERLFADSIVTRTQLDDARTQRDVTEAQLRAAEFNRQYAVVRAPASGIVLRRTVEAGQLVSANSTVIVLRTDRRGLVLRAAAADRDAVRIKQGESASVSFDAFPGERFAGRVERVGFAATPTTGTYEVEIAVTPGATRLASGLIGRASLSPRSVAGKELPLIPAEALLEVDGDAATVFVLDDAGRAVRRLTVRVAFLDGPMAAIAAGLPSGARVVTAGATRVADGSMVTVIAERAP